MRMKGIRQQLKELLTVEQILPALVIEKGAENSMENLHTLFGCKGFNHRETPEQPELKLS